MSHVKDRLEKLCGMPLNQAEDRQVYEALLTLVQECAHQKAQPVKGRKLYYISAEFLIGKLLSNNLINLGMYEEVKACLAEAGKSIQAMEKVADGQATKIVIPSELQGIVGLVNTIKEAK